MKKAIAVLLVFAIAVLCAACAPLEWDTFVLGDKIPSLADKKGELQTNTEDRLWVEVTGMDNESFNAYIESCKEMGYTIDAEQTDISYAAFNEEGYKLSLSLAYDYEMTIQLDVPMELTEFEWPKNGVTGSFPKPESNIGKIEWEQEDSFLIYVGNTPIEAYRQYVDRCADAGYTVDYEKGDKYYRADNADGYHLELSYEGFNTMYIRVDEALGSANSDSETQNSDADGSDEDQVGENDWKATFSQNGFTQDEIASCEEMLNKVGVTDFHDVEITENGRMHIVTGKIFDSDALQLNITLEDRKIIVITLAGLPDTDTEAYINWRGKLKFRTVNTKRSVDLYYDVEGGYLAVLDWENKTITAVEQ